MFNNLEAEQARRRLTNKEVAEILGISRQLYEARKVNGRFKLKEIKTLCQLFECSFEYLFAASAEQQSAQEAKMKKEIKGELKEDYSKIITDDDLCEAITGFNMEELTRKIIENKDGEFDQLFA